MRAAQGKHRAVYAVGRLLHLPHGGSLLTQGMFAKQGQGIELGPGGVVGDGALGAAQLGAYAPAFIARLAHSTANGRYLRTQYLGNRSHQR